MQASFQRKRPTTFFFQRGKWLSPSEKCLYILIGFLWYHKIRGHCKLKVRHIYMVFLQQKKMSVQFDLHISNWTCFHSRSNNVLQKSLATTFCSRTRKFYTPPFFFGFHSICSSTSSSLLSACSFFQQSVQMYSLPGSSLPLIDAMEIYDEENIQFAHPSLSEVGWSAVIIQGL